MTRHRKLFTFLFLLRN